jgi:hypothetical protein
VVDVVETGGESNRFIFLIQERVQVSPRDRAISEREKITRPRRGGWSCGLEDRLSFLKMRRSLISRSKSRRLFLTGVIGGRKMSGVERGVEDQSLVSSKMLL